MLVDGVLVVFLERGGKSLLTFTDDIPVLTEAAERLVREGKDGRLGKVAVERIDGVATPRSPMAAVLLAAGLSATPRGLRLRP